ncbi:transposase [Roseomonas sp. KE2513]|uniref:IS66-like element accessory protein TnpA n=1 Tax=Roseomonas sp. KE2513 TaxID=2479202 RepID=UPI0018DF42EE|nr:transposase [Roseomonas sp. KE2513]MBI0539810.1 transposase [Roseomonas sp. KE2513]
MARWVSSTGARTGASTGAGIVAMERVEIVTRGGRRTYTAEEKAALLAEVGAPGARVLAVAQRHGVAPSLLHRWRREAEGRPVKPKVAPHLPPFVPLVVGPSGSDPVAEAVTPTLRERVGAAVEVVLRNGRVLRVGGDADVAVVARLAAALEA